jgi:hypothetical protein
MQGAAAGHCGRWALTCQAFSWQNWRLIRMMILAELMMKLTARVHRTKLFTRLCMARKPQLTSCQLLMFPSKCPTCGITIQHQ